MQHLKNKYQLLNHSVYVWLTLFPLEKLSCLLLSSVNSQTLLLCLTSVADL